MLILGQGALRAADGARGARRSRASSPTACGMVRDGLERLQRAAYARRRGSAASISASCRGAGGRDVAGILDGAAQGEIEVLYLLGADEIDIANAGQGLRDLPGPSRRSRRGARRRRSCRAPPTPRRTRTYVNTEGRRAARPQRAIVPARRGARGLGDPARAVGGARPARCRFDTPASSCARAHARGRAADLPAARRDRAGDVGSFGAERRASTRAPFRLPIADFYRTDPISRALRDHGRVQRRLRRRRAAGRPAPHG